MSGMENNNREHQQRIISKNLSRLLAENDMNQADLANILGITESAVGKWILCHNAPSMANIQKIAKYFNISKSDILEDKTDQEGYYLSEETKEIANKIAKNKELKILFDAAKDAPAEDLMMVHEMIKALKRKERGNG